jgi:O-antigen ligase
MTGPPAPALPDPRAVPPQRLRWTLSFIGVLFYIFTVTTYRMPVADVGIVIALVGLLTERPRLKLPKFLIWFGAFILWGCFGLLWTRYPQLTQEHITYLTKMWVISFVFCNALRDEPKVRAYMLFMLACFFTHAGRGSIQNYLTGNTLHGRAVWNGEFANPNFLAGIAILELASAAAVLTIERRTWARWFAIACLILTPIVILATQSRSNFIGLVVFGLLGLLSMKGRKRIRVAGAMLGLTIIGVALAPKGVWERVGGLGKVSRGSDMKDVDAEGSAAERYRILQTGLTILGDNPLTGTGLKTFSRTNAEYTPELGRKDAHNTYLSVAVETGLIGLALFVTMLVSCLRGTVSRRTGPLPAAPTAVWLRNGMIAFLVAALWATVVGLQFTYLHLALIWAVMQLQQQGKLAAPVAAPVPPAPVEPATPPRLII